MNAPVIYLVDQATRNKGYAAKLATPLTLFVKNYFGPVWGTYCTIVLSAKPVKGAWNLIFLDDADAADALGYHEYYHGQPLGKVFVQTTLDDGEKVSVTASHELAEMLVDPTANLTAKGPNGVTYAYESADPVEETYFTVAGYPMTNFVTPQWFENLKHPKGTKYDFLGNLTKPFSLQKGGYAAVQIKGKWTQIFASKQKEKRWKKEDRRGHRNEELRNV